MGGVNKTFAPSSMDLEMVFGECLSNNFTECIEMPWAMWNPSFRDTALGFGGVGVESYRGTATKAITFSYPICVNFVGWTGSTGCWGYFWTADK